MNQNEIIVDYSVENLEVMQGRVGQDIKIMRQTVVTDVLIVVFERRRNFI